MSNEKLAIDSGELVGINRFRTDTRLEKRHFGNSPTLLIQGVMSRFGGTKDEQFEEEFAEIHGAMYGKEDSIYLEKTGDRGWGNLSGINHSRTDTSLEKRSCGNSPTLLIQGVMSRFGGTKDEQFEEEFAEIHGAMYGKEDSIYLEKNWR